jgi:hypothetical protein
LKRNESGFENGYDSDGQMGPFNNMEVVEGPQDFDEVDHSERIEVPQSASKSNGDSDAERNNEAIALSEKDDGPGQHMPMTELDKKSNKDLQDELRKRGLKVGGKKGELQERLRKALEDRIPVGRKVAKGKKAKVTPGEKAATEKTKRELSAVFPQSAYWRPLVPNEEAVSEPDNTSFKKPRAPTVPEEDAATVPVKFNFDEAFDRPVFAGKYFAEDRFRNGRRRMNTIRGWAMLMCPIN